MLKKLSALPMLIFIILVAPMQAMAQQQPQLPGQPQDYYVNGPWRHMGVDGYGHAFWWMFPMMLLFILICAAIFFFAYRTSANGRQHWGPHSQRWGDPTHSALQILNERFARGEIQKDEYAEKKAAVLASGHY